MISFGFSWIYARSRGMSFLYMNNASAKRHGGAQTGALSPGWLDFVDVGMGAGLAKQAWPAR